ncbi:MAG: hypothetical protein RUMPE_00723 [Eubacteriales bacterium SKADARSKE-1]|nr:hypothetical protein [Eubacteriales bacterium SKADARSKE-1]
MITSKQRAYLRSLANSIDTILIVGKGGISTELIKQASDALLARELVKGKVLETAGEEAKKFATIIAQQTSSEVVSVIGSKFILYKKNSKTPKIILP